MAKGTGLIGNFSGKVGNTVGYNLKDSNNKQTQGIRVYQPVVKNPRTKAQAEQRARMSVINATYRALKPIIDRGQEGKAYGNKSRLAWLSQAMKNFAGPWVKKGEQVPQVAPLQVTSGSLPTIAVRDSAEDFVAIPTTLAAETAITNVKQLSDALKTTLPQLQDGDQVTIVAIYDLQAVAVSVLIGTTDTTSVSDVKVDANYLKFGLGFFDMTNIDGGTIIHSREGSNGQHLRSTQSLVGGGLVVSMSEAAKAASIASYMQEGSNTDWPQEQL